MLDSFNSETVYNDLRASAASVGSNLTELCRETGIPRSTLAKWEQAPPKSFVLLSRLFTAINTKRKPTAEPATAATNA